MNYMSSLANESPHCIVATEAKAQIQSVIHKLL